MKYAQQKVAKHTCLMRNKRFTFPSILLMAFGLGLTPAPIRANNGPILYGLGLNSVVYSIDPMTCTICPIFYPNGLTGQPAYDMVVLPNGNFLIMSGGYLNVYEPPNQDPIWSLQQNTAFFGGILAPNGLVYLTTGGPTSSLWSFDPATNTLTLIGSFDDFMIVYEFFYEGNDLYAVVRHGTAPVVHRIIQVDLTDPLQSQIIYSSMPLANWANGGIATGGYTTMNSNISTLRQYDVTTNAYTSLFCNLAVQIRGLTDLPQGVPPVLCSCGNTYAGTVNNTMFNRCISDNVTVPFNNNATLESGDVLRYILFTNPADTLGSIILQSSSPVISFDPNTMQTGVTYYLATLAGDELNGNVDLYDPCLDISNTAAQVVWHPKPTVAFSVADPNFCVGGCIALSATFTGTPPFVLTYSTPYASNVTQTFSSHSGVFQVCAPSGASPGSITVQATDLTDAWCDCL